MNDCIECGAQVRNNEAVCVNCLDVEAELMAMMQEPTAEKVRRDQIRGDVLMRDLGRALAPLVNNMLADVEKNLTKSKEGLS